MYDHLICFSLGPRILSGIAFIAKYARVPAMSPPLKGDEVTTRDRPVGEVGHQSFMHIASEWILPLAKGLGCLRARDHRPYRV